MGWFDLDSRGCVLPVINSDGDVWKISVTEDKVCKEDLEQPQEERHPDCGSEKKKDVDFLLLLKLIYINNMTSVELILEKYPLLIG